MSLFAIIFATDVPYPLLSKLHTACNIKMAPPCRANGNVKQCCPHVVYLTINTKKTKHKKTKSISFVPHYFHLQMDH